MSGTITDISPAYIEPSPDNPRRDVGDVTELAASIASVGVIEPLVVRPLGKKAGHDHYQVIVGHRRLAAAQVAGSMWVPCIVREYAEEARAEIMLIENLQRVDLSPIEEAAAFQRLVADYGWSQERLGDRIGRSQSHISKRLALVALPEKVQTALHSGGMTIETGLELAKLAKAPKELDKIIERYGAAIPPWVIDEKLREIARKEKHAKLLAKLKRDGVTIVKEPKGGWWTARNDPEYAGPMTIDNWGPLRHVDAKAHVQEECRGVYVDQYGQAVEVCTEPSRHPAGKSAAAAKRRETKAEREARREHEEAAAAVERRRAFAREVFARNLKPGDLLEVIVGSLLSTLFEEEAFDVTMICGLLGTEIPKGSDQWTSANESLASYLRGSDAKRLLLAAAAAASDGEQRCAAWRGSSFASQAWLRFLERQGHELTVGERKHMTAQIQIAAEDDACRVCGCTEENACEGGCSWVDDPEQLGNLCSRCRDERYAAGELQEAEA